MTLKLYPLVGGGHVVEQRVRVLAHEGLGVVAGDVVPLDPVAVDVVQQTQARLLRPVDVLLSVVGLRDLQVAWGQAISWARVQMDNMSILSTEKIK